VGSALPRSGLLRRKLQRPHARGKNRGGARRGELCLTLGKREQRAQCVFNRQLDMQLPRAAPFAVFFSTRRRVERRWAPACAARFA
jgi:hypothetical protein